MISFQFADYFPLRRSFHQCGVKAQYSVTDDDRINVLYPRFKAADFVR